nr:hypothetical protein [uncultured Acetatifactor sp.]
MGNFLNVGNAGFRPVRKGDYVDRTELIFYNNEQTKKHTCVIEKIHVRRHKNHIQDSFIFCKTGQMFLP